MSRGGGIFIAIHNSIQSSLIFSDPDFEILAIKILIPKPIILCTMYVPPNPSNDYVLSFFISVCSLFSYQLPIVMVGDFNALDINWSTFQCSSYYSNSLCNFIFQSQLLLDPTHIRGNTLDLILTNSDLISNISVHSSHCFISSDHFVITGSLSCPS